MFFRTWKMINFLYGIGQIMLFVMIPFSLHRASMMQLRMKYDDSLYMINLCWAPPYFGSRVALGLLMAHSSRSASLRTMLHRKPSSIGIKNFTQRITLWLIIKICSFTYILDIQDLTMMSSYCANLSYIKIGINLFCMNILIFVGGSWLFRWRDVHHGED